MLLIGGIAVLILMCIQMMNTDNIYSIEGNFQELSFARNENNTGPVMRLYAFSVEDTLWENMKQHADLLPHSKYGTTEVYYFLAEDEEAPIELNLKDSKESLFNKNMCLAYAKKDGMGRIKITRYPFR